MKTVRRAISRRAPALVRPGTYAVTYGVGYNEVQDGDAVGCVISSEPYNVTVAEATPALSATGGPTTLTAGDDYTLFPSYTDTVGDHVVSDFSVDWGDGTTNVYEEYIPAEATHTYESAGEYEPSLHVTAFKDDGGIDGTSDLVDVSDPTVGLVAEGTPTAYEDGQVPYDFAVTRSNYSDQPMTVGLNIDGSLPSSAYVATDSDGRILDGSVTIPAGSNEADVTVYPLEDHTPRWTETVDVTLTGGSTDYAIDDDNSAAGCYVVNDDLYAWLDNGSDNDIFEGGLPSDGGTLVPLVLDLPTETRSGAEITLTDNAPTEADVYTTADPGDDDVPILGDVSGTTVSEVTWTQGTDDTAPHGQTTLWVEGISGSASINDISFEIYDSDANCGSGGTASDPTLPQYDGDGVTPTYATTTVSDLGNPAADFSYEIVSLNDPNPDDISGVVTDETRNWLVGQMVDLQVGVDGPPMVQPNAVSWSIDGGAGSNVLYNYTDTNTSTTLQYVPLFNNNVGGSGYREKRIQFFWVVADSFGDSSAMHTVSVSVGTPMTGPDLVYHASTTFDVFEPTSSLTISQRPTSAPFIPQGQAQWIVQLGSPFKDFGGGPGIALTGSVQDPTAVTDEAGQWKFVQLATLNGSRTETLANGGAENKQLAPVSGLDLNDPYNVINNTNYEGVAIFSTGDTSEMLTDSPNQPLGTSARYVSAGNFSRSFTSYLMFLPPSGADSSKWVPLEFVDWEWKFSISIPNNLDFSFHNALVQNPAPVGPNAVGPTPAFEEPTWSLRVQDHLDWS